jgi:integrase
MQDKRKAPEGIQVRHSKRCGSRDGDRCGCSPSYQANVWSNRDRRRIRKTFPALSAAKAWRREAQLALDRGTLRAPSPMTLREVSEAWLGGVRDGSVRNRNGEQYKPSAIRGYERCLRLRILPALGAKRLTDVQRRDVQAFVDRLLAEGLDPSTIKNTLNPLQAIYRRAVQREEVAINPTSGLDIPRSQGRRDRVASPSEGAQLIACVPTEDRAVWATAMYAGLRRGELRALRWSDVDLASGVIRVERGWDDEEGEVAGKTRAARRTVPVASVLRDHLVEHKLRSGRNDGLVFGTSPTAPFQPSNLRRRALTAWKAAELEPIGLHESRHTFASLMIAAGVNAKALSTYMGHASVSITFDRYGHLMPGNEAEAAGMLDAYLARSASARQSRDSQPVTHAVESGRERPTVSL